MSNPSLSIILVNFNERDHLRRVLGKLQEEFTFATEVLVVDNDSRDGSAEYIRMTFSAVKVIESGQNLMYGKGNNLGMAQASGDWFLLLNPDVDWQSGQLRSFVTVAQSKTNLGAAGPRIQNPSGSLQRSAHHAFPSWASTLVEYCLPLQQILMRAGQHPQLDSEIDHTRTHSVAHLTGVCLLVPRTVYGQVGGFDSAFTMYIEETEWQKRMINQGLVNWLIAETSITHYGSAQKTFAQASRHFLWGMWHYTDKHWRGPGRHWRFLTSVWLATALTLVLVLPMWPISPVLGRIGRRLRHYTRQYLRLIANLITFPTRPPSLQ